MFQKACRKAISIPVVDDKKARQCKPQPDRLREGWRLCLSPKGPCAWQASADSPTRRARPNNMEFPNLWIWITINWTGAMLAEKESLDGLKRLMHH